MQADLANVPTNDPASLSQWSFAHMAHHRDINRVIYQRFKVSIPEYSLDPMDVNNLGVFGYQHQVMHNNQNRILGIAGNDLTDVNWEDAGQREEWVFLNFSEHFRAANILGI